MLQEALRDPAVISRFAELSMEPVAQDRATPAALRDFLEKEIVRWARILKEAGVQPR